MKYIPAALFFILAILTWLMSFDKTPGSSSRSNSTFRLVAVTFLALALIAGASMAVIK